MGIGLAGCGADNPSPTGGPASGEPSIVPGPVAMATRDGIRVTLTLERAPLPSTQRTRALIVVDNLSPEVRSWQGGGCDFLATVTVHTSVDVVPDPGRDWPGTAGRFKRLVSPGSDPADDGPFIDERFADAPERMFCPANIAVNRLEPGQRLQMRADWNGEIAYMAAPAGPATVSAEFPYLGQSEDSVDPLGAAVPIVVSLDTKIVDTAVRFLSAGRVIDAALSDARFAAWLAEGDATTWQEADFLTHGTTADVVLSLLEDDVSTEGRATVDRETGVVLAFEVTPP